ncbi:MAG: transporter [Bacteroidales bacterium]|nr:transporter [Bacteroidales bacterium]
MSQVVFEGYFVLFLIITLGIVLGNIRFRGFSLDISAVIFVALILGHYGFIVPPAFQTIGLLFFIFAIGIQAGPGFFGAFQKFGRQLLIVCIILVTLAAGIGYILGYTYDIDPFLGVGLFNGALTSTPGLAAAIDITGSPLASIGYGVAYPAGAVLTILIIHFLPVVMGVDLKKEEKKYIDKITEEFPRVINKNFVVENQNIHGKSLKELKIGTMTQAVISRVKHENQAFTPNADTCLFLGDIVKGVGTEAALHQVEFLIGKVSEEEISLAEDYDVNWVLVTNKEVINKSLNALNLTAYYGGTITRIRRSGIDLSPQRTSTLRFGDKVLLACGKENMSKVMKLLGNDEKRLRETDFLPISLGIVLGILVGSVNIPFFGLFDFSLGLTGGVLTTALLLSRIGKTGPIVWSMSGSGNQLLRKLGLLMFLAAVGTDAGAHIVETLAEHGWKLLWIGMAITVVPMVFTTLIGHYFLKLNFLTLLGVVAGSMTSTPGLAAADSKTETDAASVGYATVYPMALVLMIIFSQVLSMI